MLSTKGIHYSIGKKEILKNISINFLPGEFNMILGPNGSGKSTFLKICSGEIKPTGGTIFIDDKQLSSIKKEDSTHFTCFLSSFFCLNFECFSFFSFFPSNYIFIFTLFLSFLWEAYIKFIDKL